MIAVARMLPEPDLRSYAANRRDCLRKSRSRRARMCVSSESEVRTEAETREAPRATVLGSADVMQFTRRLEEDWLT